MAFTVSAILCHSPDAVSSEKSAGVTGQPNIVIIMSDDQGANDAGYRGNPFFETPHIDRIATTGMVFENAYVCAPSCSPSRSCMISGMLPPRHQVYMPGRASRAAIDEMPLLTPVNERFARQYAREEGRPLTSQMLEDARNSFELREGLEPEVVSIAQVLNQAGYNTARIGKWHVGEDNQGFDFSTGTGVPGVEELMYRDPYSAEKLTDAGIKFMRASNEQGNPFFLFLSHYEVHIPLVAHEHVVAKYERKLKEKGFTKDDFDPTYAAMVEAFDVSVGRVLDELEDMNVRDNTLVIYTSDNGGLEPVTDNAPLRAGKHSLYEGGVRVPAAMSWPAVIESGSTTGTPVSLTDFLPTFASIAGAPMPDQIVDGADFSSVLYGQDDSDLYERPLFWHFPLYLRSAYGVSYLPKKDDPDGWRLTPSSAVRKGDWKLVEFFDDGRLELFNLVQDEGETTDLSQVEPEKTEALHQLLKNWRRETQAVVPQPNPHYEG